MKKTVIRIIAAAVSVAFLSGCSEIEIIELNERLIIEAIGIDYENGIYNVTIEGLDSFSAGSESNSISAPRLTKCYKFQGETIGMAMNSISVVTGQVPLFSQARVLVLGFETARTHLSEVLDFFRREYTTRTDILIVIAKEKAENVVSADYGKNISAGNIIAAAIESSRHTGTSCYIPLYKFINSVMGETDSPYCPLISTKQNVFSEQMEVELLGTIILGKNNDCTVLSKENTLGLQIINNDIKNGDITVETEDGLCTLEIIECKTRKKVQLLDQKAAFKLEITLRCDIPEYQSKNFEGLSKVDTEEIAKSASNKIAGLIYNIIDNIYFDKNYDIFSFGRMVNLKDNNFYSQKYIAGNHIENSQKCDISVDLSIRRIGKIILAQE